MNPERDLLANLRRLYAYEAIGALIGGGAFLSFALAFPNMGEVTSVLLGITCPTAGILGFGLMALAKQRAENHNDQRGWR